MTLMTLLGFVVLLAPILLLAAVGLPTLAGRPLTERRTIVTMQAAIGSGLVAAIAVLVLMLLRDTRHVPVDFGTLISMRNYHFSARFVFDRLSVPMVILSYVLCGTVGAFAGRYMHREKGFNRFFVLYAVFLAGMVIASLAGTIEMLFSGWEMVGLSSALLVAFFHERPAPVRNGLRIWSVYRAADAALLLAAVMLHRTAAEGNFSKLMGSGVWPLGSPAITSKEALLIGLLLLVAAAGKSALVPFSGWLPRAMEGPTPSSAVFYGALSVHLGAFLLLRVSPMIVLSPWLCFAITILGLLTSAYAALVGRVQTDIKSALSFASLTQVGLIVAEIGSLPAIFGPAAAYVPLVHLLGHACLRTLQFVRAPNLLQDYRILENAIGDRLTCAVDQNGQLFSSQAHSYLYRFALERGYFDAFLTNYIAGPLLAAFQRFDAIERRWTDILAGQRSRESDRVPPAASLVEDLL